MTLRVGIGRGPRSTRGGPLALSGLPPTAFVGEAFAYQVAIRGGKAPYSVAASNLPAWLTANTAGLATGTPPAVAIASVTFTVTDSLGATATLTVPFSSVSRASALLGEAGSYLLLESGGKLLLES
ncbi:Ig domain-containing protein [uncultured Methylobacterium sp.]|uniref:Ig domain-containing protein n=1 Tax=uncultured Methylobacterium sp. TaxID=157278 RepID=UPI0035CC46CE